MEKIIYEEEYISKINITLIMKKFYKNEELIKYEIVGYYFGTPDSIAFELYKDTLIKK